MINKNLILPFFCLFLYTCPHAIHLSEALTISEILEMTGDDPIIGGLTAHADASDVPGAAEYIKHKKVLPMTLESAYSRAMEENYTIKIARENIHILESELDLSKHAFSPTLNLTVGYFKSNSYERSEYIGREREVEDDDVTVDEEFEEFEELLEDSDFSDPITCITIDDILINPECMDLYSTEYSVEEEFASGESVLKEWYFDFDISKRFSWGITANAGIFSSYRIRENESVAISSFEVALDMGNKHWKSILSGDISVPIPLLKDFGPYGSTQSINVLVGEVRISRSKWELKRQINAVLREVDNTYWEVVRSIKQIHIIAEHRGSFERMAEHSKHLYDIGQRTEYGKLQVEAELENLRDNEEIAWNVFIKNSNKLSDLLNLERNVLITPVKYGDYLNEQFAFVLNQAISKAIDENPELKMSKADIKINDILVKHKKNQLRPDMDLTASIEMGQTYDIYGYDTFEESLSNIFDPDYRNYFVGFTFKLPLTNLKVRSSYKQSALSLSQARNSHTTNENRVSAETGDLLSMMTTARARITLSGENMELAEMVYKLLLKLRAVELADEFKIVTKYRDLLTARSSFIDALIDYRKTYAGLLSMWGGLPGPENDYFNGKSRERE